MGGRGVGRVSAGNSGGGGVNMFFRGQNSRQEKLHCKQEASNCKQKSRIPRKTSLTITSHDSFSLQERRRAPDHTSSWAQPALESHNRKKPPAPMKRYLFRAD